MEVNLRFFGDIDITEEYRVEDIKFKNSIISIDTNDVEDLNEKQISILQKFLEKLEKIEDKAYSEILKDFKERSIKDYGVKHYINFHLEELEDKDLSKLIDINSENKEEELLNNLKINRIGIYADDLERYAIFDYTIGEEITDELISVYMKATTEVTDIVMES